MTINKPNNAETQTKKFKLAPDFAGTEQRVAHDFEQASEIMTLFDKERGIEENPLLSSSDWEGFSVCSLLLLWYLFKFLFLLLFRLWRSWIAFFTTFV